MSRFIKAWTCQDDADLMEGIANGLSIEQAGKQIGRSKGASIGRFNRLKQSLGWQAVEV